MAPTRQPEVLKTDDHVPWCWGRGHEVWAMLQAASQGDAARLTQLLTSEPSLIRCECGYRTPLHYAVRENQLDAAKLLIDHGADATYISGQSWHDSPLTMATERGYDAMREMLSEHLQTAYGICPAGDEVAAAFRQRDPPRTIALLDEFGIQVADSRGNRPIHWAVMTRQIPLIDLLLQRGVDINAQRPDGARPLDLTNGDYWYRGWRDPHPHAAKNHWPLVGYLLAKGAHYDLTTACRVGDMDRVQEILADDPTAANADADYNTWYSGFPLRSAAKAGHLEIVKLLLKHGADPNKPEHGLAPFGGALYDALQHRHINVARLLLEHGANPNQDVESSGNCFYTVDDDAARKLLWDHGGRPDIRVSIEENCLDDVAFQFRHDPESANDPKLFAFAVETGKQAFIELLLQYHPDLPERMPAPPTIEPNQTDWHGVHALHYGCDKAELREWLARGADINILDGEHQSSPLGWAARHGKRQYAQWLLEHGADPRAAGGDWALPRQWAIRREHPEIAELLRQHGA